MLDQHVSRADASAVCKILCALFASAAPLLAGVGLIWPHGARALPAFAQQTGLACKACHVGGFGPELTVVGREFKLGGYTLRAHSSVPLAAMAIASWTHTRRDQSPAPPHLSRNDNLVLDQASLFVAGGIGQHLGGFAQVTYSGVDRAWAWDNLDLRAVTTATVLGADCVFGLTLNNNPTVEDPWNTLPAWGFPFTDTAVSPTPAAALLIDGSLAQNVIGASAYGWIDHHLYIEAGTYSSPSRGTINALGADPDNPGSVHGVAPYGRVAYQAPLAGGTFEIGANAFKAAIFPGRDRSAGIADQYMDWGIDSSWLKTLGRNDSLTADVRLGHERGDLRASCTLGLVGDGIGSGCARYHLTEWRAALRYTLHDHLGLTVSPFRISGSRNVSLFGPSGKPDSSGIMGEVDYTLWPAGDSPLGRLVNSRVGVQYTRYRKFNGREHNFDGAGANGRDNNALRLFAWVAF